MQPILDAVSEATGWAVTFLAGGPEPADGGEYGKLPSFITNSVHSTGRLNVVNLHGGSAAGSVGMSFGTAMRIPYKHMVLPVFGEFLKLCFGVLRIAPLIIPKLITFAQARKSANDVLCQSMAP